MTTRYRVRIVLEKLTFTGRQEARKMQAETLIEVAFPSYHYKAEAEMFYRDVQAAATKVMRMFSMARSGCSTSSKTLACAAR